MAKESQSLKQIEVWAAEKKTPPFDFLMAKIAVWGNVQGREVDEKAFDAGILAATKAELKGY